MINTKNLLLLLTCLIIVSCNKNENVAYIQQENSSVFKDSLELEHKKLVKLPLDSVTTFWHYSANISNSNNDDTSYFSFINAGDQSITYFNLDDKIGKKIFLEQEGENGVGVFSETMVHLMVDENEFYVYNMMTGNLFNIDSTATVKNKYKIVDYENDIDVPFPEPSGTNPIIKVGNELYFSCNLDKQRNNFDDYGMVLKYNLTSREKEYILPLPDQYNKAFWGSPYRYIPNLEYNTKEKSLILGYPVSQFVYKSDLKGGVTDSTYVGSKDFEAVEYMSLDLDYILSNNRDFKREDMFSLSNHDYARIIYDDFNELYYRIAYIRPELEMVKRGQTYPGFSIIICDKNLRKIGETKFSADQYDVSMMGVTKEGLLVARRDLYNFNDDEFTFSVFGPSEIK